MSNDLAARIRRWSLRILGRSRGEVRLLQDLRHLREVGRFAAVFALLVLLPALALAWISFDSSTAVESSVDLDARLRAESVVRQIDRDFSASFEQFELAAETRFRSGESLLTDLPRLAPTLRGAYRFDANGVLDAPFRLPPDAPSLPPSPRVVRALDAARAAEAQGRGAIPAWQAAIDTAATDPVRRAEAQLGLARSLWRAGDGVAAQRVLDLILQQGADAVDETGFRAGDLAELLRGEIRLGQDPTAGATELRTLTERLLAERWTVGTRDRTALTRRALALLEPSADPDWLARTRTRFNELADQLWLASRIQDELELLGEPLGQPDRFVYLPPRSESPVLWAQLDHGQLYAFAFSVDALRDEVIQRADRLSEYDRDLQVLCRDASAEPPPEALASATLGPWLPSLSVYALPSDPAAFAALKRSRRWQRAAAVVLATLLVAMGVLTSARIVGREVETARMKADFAANVSHELRSPITQIRLKAEALQLGLTYDEADTLAHYDAIVKQSERLSRLVDNVLDFAAIERGIKRYQLRPDDVEAVIATAVEAARPDLTEAQVTLEVAVPPDLPAIWMDRDAMGQVVTNLLSNAIKYGGTGRWARIAVAVVGDRVEIAVSDRGVGISRTDVDRVFEHFFRSTDVRVRRVKGTGIGLTICRYIVEAHGGTIQADSAPGEGSTFTVTLPLQPPET
jgi:signal transduction histidine kinase